MEHNNMLMMFILFVILICFAGAMYGRTNDNDNINDENPLESPGVVTLDG